jgi:hypothetical protein
VRPDGQGTIDPLVFYISAVALLLVVSIAARVWRHVPTRVCPLCSAKVELGRQRCQVCSYRFDISRWS